MSREAAVGFVRGTPLVPGRARHVEVPSDARARSKLARIDYQDAFVVETSFAQLLNGERWARAMLEDAPTMTRSALTSGWSALGLRLGSIRSERLVLGWEIASQGPEFALLAARSHLGFSAELLFERRPRALLFATFIEAASPVARAIWVPLGPWHRQVVRYLLEQGTRRRLASRPAP